MNLNERVKRVAALPPRLRNVLAKAAQGMSNDQIAVVLGYKNRGTIATLMSEVYVDFELRSVASTVQKRALAVQAFQRATDVAFKIPIINRDLTLRLLSNVQKRKLQSALQEGYEIDSISIVLRKP